MVALDERAHLKRLLPVLRRLADGLDLEVVVSDGGSTDGSLAIATRWADRVVVHDAPEPQTIGAGRNAGAAAARSSLLVFLNADVALPDRAEAFLKSLLEAAREHGAATCRVAVAPERARPADRVVLGTCNLVFRAMNAVGIGMGRGECQAVRGDLFASVGGYRAGLWAGEDFDLFRRLALKARRAGRPHPVRFLAQWTVYEDPRRYRARGYARTMAAWFLNTLYVSFRGRSFSRAWEPVR